LAGVPNTLKLAADMGLTTLSDPERYGLTLVLGGGEVRLLDMTHAYGVFANEGIKVEPRSIIRIEDTRGNIVYESKIESRQVLDRNVALMISDVLNDRVARQPLWGNSGLVDFPGRDVASKTGSTNNLRDAWLMGYSPNFVAGAWVGNNDNRPMGGGLSGLIVTPMWKEFMLFALEKRENVRFAQPTINLEGVKPILRGEYIDANLILQQLETSDEPNEDVVLNIQNITGNIHNILHFVDRANPRGPYPSNPASDPQYRNWEYAVQEWKNTTYGAILNLPSAPVDTEIQNNEQ
jgi:membrane peptidoglycan carboxypeptidase